MSEKVHANANQLLSRPCFSITFFQHSDISLIIISQMKLYQEDDLLKCRFSCTQWILSYPKLILQFLICLLQHPKFKIYLEYMKWYIKFLSWFDFFPTKILKN